MYERLPKPSSKTSTLIQCYKACSSPSTAIIAYDVPSATGNQIAINM